MEITLILHNIRSSYNVGAILRTAEGFGVEKVILSGYTPKIDDENLLPHLRDKLNQQIHKTALGAEEMLEIYSSDDIFSEIIKFKEAGYQLVGLENNLEDERLFLLNYKGLREKIGGKIMLLLGEEVNGIDYSFYDIIDYFVEIPMVGKKESFNVSVAAGIALYELSNLEVKNEK